MSNVHIFEKPGRGSQITQIAIFKQIWMVSNKRSFISGLFLREFLNTDLFINCFAHVLAKGQNQYPYFKYYARNIVLLTPGEHALLDQGTEEARISYSLNIEERTKGKSTADWQKLYALRDDLKKEYDKMFPTRIGLVIGYKYSPEEQMAKIGMANKKYFESILK
jgi:hypothetical protein